MDLFDKNERKTTLVIGIFIIVLICLELLKIIGLYLVFGAVGGFGLSLYLMALIKLTSFETHSKASSVWVYTLILLIVALIIGSLLSLFIVPYLFGYTPLKIPIAIFETIHTNLIVGSSIIVAIAAIFGKNNKLLLKQTILMTALIIFLSLISLEILLLSSAFAFYLLVIINTEFLLVASLFRILYNIISNKTQQFEITYKIKTGAIRDSKEYITILDLKSHTPKDAFLEIKSDGKKMDTKNTQDRLFLEIKNSEIEKIRKL